MGFQKYAYHAFFIFWMLVGVTVAGFGIYLEARGAYYNHTASTHEEFVRGANLVFNGYFVAALGIIILFSAALTHYHWQKRQRMEV